MLPSALLALLLLADQAPPPIPPAATEPAFATAGSTKPSEAQKHCVASSIRLPRSFAGLDGTLVVKFAVGPDGEVSRFEALSDPPGVIAEAAWLAIRGCRFNPGKDERGIPQLMWVILPLRFASDSPAALASATPPATSASGAPPGEEKQGCIANQFHYRHPPNRLLHGRLELKVEVSAEGRPTRFQFPPGLPEDVVEAFTLSVQACDLRPATAPGGAAVAGTMTRVFDFTEPDEAKRAEEASRLKQPARLASNACLYRLRPTGVIGHALVLVRVSETGAPSNFRIQPENTPANMRLQLMEVLSHCTWEPAVGLDDRPVAADTAVTIRYK